MNTPKLLIPSGTARDALASVRRELAAGASLRPAFPRDLLAGATQWDDGPEMLHLAWELARCAPEASESELRGLVLLGFCALAAIREGSTRVAVRGPLAAGLRRELLEPLGARDEDLAAVEALLEQVPASAAPVLGVVGEHRPLLLEGDWLYTQRMRHFEDRLVEGLRARLAQPQVVKAAEAKRALEKVLARPPRVNGRTIELSAEQREAVLAAVQRPFTVITGGPGTGKTSIVVSILRTLGQLGLAPAQLALAAPTGKAANRMDESVRAQLAAVLEQDAADSALLAAGSQARTLHRLLGYSPHADRFAHHDGNRLAEEVVIVDESSMIDLFLMDRLVRSVRPQARLVLLGDAEQLPSVEAGAVFRDLIPQGGEADPRAKIAVRLTESFRMSPSDPAGRNVLTVARAINAGELPRLRRDGALEDGVVRTRESADALAFEGVELLPGPIAGPLQRAFLDRWWSELRDAEYERLVRHAWHVGPQGCAEEDTPGLQKLFARVESARLLCLTRAERELSGTGGVNAYFHARALEQLKRSGDGLRGEPELLPGEPILVERNDYGRRLYNGDQGLVLRAIDAADGRQHFMAVFRAGEGFRAFHLDGLREELGLAHAMTVHKAQGSEFARVGLVLPSHDLPLLTRELLYTAVTRAKRSVVIAGPEELLAAGVSRRLSRHSGIGERLASVAPAKPRRARPRSA